MTVAEFGVVVSVLLALPVCMLIAALAGLGHVATQERKEKMIDPIKTRDSKYTFTIAPAGDVHIDRYDLKDWVVISGGCNAVGSLLYEIEELRANAPQRELEQLREELTERKKQNANLLLMIEGKLGECFAGGATMRRCRICDDIVVGGPTAHVGCLMVTP